MCIINKKEVSVHIKKKFPFEKEDTLYYTFTKYTFHCCCLFCTHFPSYYYSITVYLKIHYPNAIKLFINDKKQSHFYCNPLRLFCTHTFKRQRSRKSEVYTCMKHSKEAFGGIARCFILNLHFKLMNKKRKTVL